VICCCPLSLSRLGKSRDPKVLLRPFPFVTGISSAPTWRTHHSAVFVIRAPVTLPVKRSFSAMFTQPSDVGSRCDDPTPLALIVRKREAGFAALFAFEALTAALPSKMARLRKAKAREKADQKHFWSRALRPREELPPDRVELRASVCTRSVSRPIDTVDPIPTAPSSRALRLSQSSWLASPWDVGGSCARES
jgi:hypothetical protein